MPYSIGPYLGLTGTKIHHLDMLYLDLAQFYVPSSKLKRLEKELLENDKDSPETLIRKYSRIVSHEMIEKGSTLYHGI